MIPIRLLNGASVYINAELVETIAAAHDTIITLTTGRTIVTSTGPEELLEAVLEYRRRVHGDCRFPTSDCQLTEKSPAATNGPEIGNRNSAIENPQSPSPGRPTWT